MRKCNHQYRDILVMMYGRVQKTCNLLRLTQRGLCYPRHDREGQFKVSQNQIWSGSSVGQNATLSLQRSRVRVSSVPHGSQPKEKSKILSDTSERRRNGELVERLNTPVLKTGILETVSGVRIPDSPHLLGSTSGQVASLSRMQHGFESRTEYKIFFLTIYTFL